MRRTSAIVTVAIGLVMLGVSAWCISAVRHVAALREQIDARIGVINEVEKIGVDLERAQRPDELSIISSRVQELARTMAAQRGPDDPAVVRARAAAQASAELTAIAEHADTSAVNARVAMEREIHALAPELRTENRAMFAELSGYIDVVHYIAALAVTLAGIITILLGYLFCVALPRMRDTSERMQLLATKLAGTPTAYGISHGMGGPLTVATTSLQLLRERMEKGPDEDAKRLLDDAIHALARATGTLQDMRGSSNVDDESSEVLVPPVERAPSELRILLIDDDEMVAVSTKRVLTGHRVETEHDGAQGIARALSEPFDLILCDLMMPGQSGIDVFRRLQKERPELVERFVVMSGGANDEEAAVFLDGYRGPRLDKPFGTKQLRDLVARFGKREG